MKIAIDFDDTMVDTITQFCKVYNANTDPRTTRAAATNFKGWYISKYLGCTPDFVVETFNKIDYDDVSPNKDAVLLLLAIAHRHDVTILTSNDRYRDIRDWLNAKGLQHIPLVHGIGNKAGWLRENFYDVLVDDRPSSLKGAVTVGVTAIRMNRPWNVQMESGLKNNTPYTFQWGQNDKELTANGWRQIGQHIEEISGERLDIGFAIRETIGGSLTRSLTKTYLERNANSNKMQQVFGDDLDVDTVVNENGAKQSRIEGRFDLLPALAVKEVAKVLATGADKYGEDNWKGLSIDEINNHTYNHLLGYQQNANTEDLSHAACRALMALQLHLEGENG